MANYTDTSDFTGVNWPKGKEHSGRSTLITAANHAAAIIDFYVSKCYTVPFTAPLPAIVVTISDMLTRTIVEWILNQGRLPDIKELVEDKAGISPIGMLELVCTGEKDIPGGSRLSTTGPWVSPNIEDFTPIFELDDDKYHEVDIDKLDYLEGTR